MTRLAPHCVCFLALGLVAGCRGPARKPPPADPGPAQDSDASARAWFHRRHRGERPLNWAVGQAAMCFYRTRPMGRFVLHRNDCSDFGECALDEALGVQARFRRRSDRHLIGARDDVLDCLEWAPGVPVQPGDLVFVSHSPWYAPRAGSIGHVGVVGTDGYVYDFVKLRRWLRARYGRHSFEWFVRHSRGRGQTLLARLKPEYRYRVKTVPEAGDGPEGGDGPERGREMPAVPDGE